MVTFQCQQRDFIVCQRAPTASQKRQSEEKQNVLVTRPGDKLDKGTSLCVRIRCVDGGPKTSQTWPRTDHN